MTDVVGQAPGDTIHEGAERQLWSWGGSGE